MLFQCQSAPKLLIRVGNIFGIKSVVTAHSTMRKLFQQSRGYINCSNVGSVSASVRTATKQAIPASYLLPSAVCMSTKSFSAIERKNIVFDSPSLSCTKNNILSNLSSVKSTPTKNKQEHLLSVDNLISQFSQTSCSIHTCTTHLVTYGSNTLNNRHSAKHNFLSPTPTKELSSCGLHSTLNSCNRYGQLFGSARRGLHSSPQCRDIYIIESEEEFEKKVMESKLPVVINFHADWCEPCHALKPLLEGLAEKHQGRMHLAEIKVDDHVALLHLFEVTAVPAVLGVVKGQVTEKFVGLISETEVVAFVNTMIGE